MKRPHQKFKREATIKNGFELYYWGESFCRAIAK